MKDKTTGLPLRLCDATERFAAEYFIRHNTNYTFPLALREAGYSPSYVHSYADKLWANVGVQELLSKLKAQNEAKTQKYITAEEIIAGLRAIAIPPPGVVVKNCDKLRAFELLGKTLALYKDSHIVGEDEQQRELTEAQRKTVQEFGVWLMQKRLEASETGTQPVVELAAEPDHPQGASPPRPTPS